MTVPIPKLVTLTLSNHLHGPRCRRRRFDPVLACALVLLAGVASWTMAPLATGAGSSVSSDTRIEVDVPVSTSVTPGWQTGTSVRLPDVSVPGEPRDVTSSGWRMSTNWRNGYEVRIRATTDPALRGLNSVDGDGARSSFADFKTASSCPCPWSGAGYTSGVFGYSISVSASSGSAPRDAAKWGTAAQRNWRGFTKSSYRAYSTSGGAGQYTMSVHLRSMIPDGAVQPEGSYRSGIVVSAHPLL